MAGVWGVDECIAELRGIGERSTRHMRRVLEKEGKEVEELARLNAPHKEGNIEDALDTRVEIDDDNRKLVIVFLNPDKCKRSDVEDYGLACHEGFWTFASGRWGQGSMSKWAMWGRPQTGWKFLERAVDEREKAFVKAMQEALERGLK